MNTDITDEADIDTLLYCVRNGGETGTLAAAEIKRRLDTAERLARRMGATFKPEPEPPKYSAKWISQQIGQRSWLPLRDCSICGEDIGYVVNHDSVWFRSSCGCGLPSRDRRTSFEEIAEILAGQPSDKIRDRTMARLLEKKI